MGISCGKYIAIIFDIDYERCFHVRHVLSHACSCRLHVPRKQSRLLRHRVRPRSRGRLLARVVQVTTFLGGTRSLSSAITEVGSNSARRHFCRFYILSTGVRPSSFMPLASTCLALSYRPMSATFFSGLSAYTTLIVFAFLLLVSLAS